MLEAVRTVEIIHYEAIITILDDSDPNWWRGSSNRGTADESDAANATIQQSCGGCYLSSCLAVRPNRRRHLLKCIQILENSDPTGEVADPSELAYYEQMSIGQSATIEKKLSEIDKQLNMLAQVDVAIRDVLAK
uniref:Uncharacterized protein n=1 Tax=Ditylenchus dipsaci TaxID=166011 RepID=A0A915CU95_9BILA